MSKPIPSASAERSTESGSGPGQSRLEQILRRWRRGAPVVIGALVVGLPVQRRQHGQSAGETRGARRREVLLRILGWLVAAGVVVATFFSGRPPGGASAVLTVVVLVIWSVTQFLGDTRITALLLLGMGLTGAVLDALDPEGPGYVVIFMALASITGRFGPVRSLWAVVPIAVAGAMAEVVTSRHPVSSAVNITVGMVFVFMAAAFAWATQQAHARSQALLVREEQARVSQQQAAVLGERNRLARELHDVLAHSLSGLAIQLSGAALLAEATAADSRLVDQIRLAQGSAHEGLANAKQALETLHADGLPGPDQLPALLDRTHALTGLVTDYEMRGSPRPLSAEAGLAIYRTAQEGITNVVRHAGRGATVQVLMDWRADDEVSIAVHDHGGDGVAAGLPSSGKGLSGLRERASQLGGEFESGMAAGGWRIKLTLPMTQR